MLEYSYDPPLIFPLTEALPIPGHRSKALVLNLPHPPNEEAEDEAFFYRLPEGPVGYFNRCTHIPVPMDMGDGDFLEPGGQVICRVHVALYELSSGAVCRPPARSGLVRVLCEEREGALVVQGWKKILEYRSGGC